LVHIQSLGHVRDLLFPKMDVWLQGFKNKVKKGTEKNDTTDQQPAENRTRRSGRFYVEPFG